MNVIKGDGQPKLATDIQTGQHLSLSEERANVRIFANYLKYLKIQAMWLIVRHRAASKNK